MPIDLVVNPRESLFWEELNSIEATGLETYKLYRLELNLFHATQFRSVAFFFSDEHGKINLTNDAPVFGMYQGVDKMGLFTALYTHPGEKQTSKLVLNPLPDLLKYTLCLYRSEERKKLAEVEITRRLLHPSVSRQPIEDPRLEGTLYVPRSKGASTAQKLPCILDLYGVAMGTKEHRRVDFRSRQTDCFRAAMLAAQGYCVMALAIFGAGKLSKKHEDVTSEYLQLAVDHLTSLPFTEDTCAIVGTSFGGTLGYHLTFKKSQVKCAVSLNGQRGHYFVSQMNEKGEKLPFTPVLPHNLPNIAYHSGFVSYARMYGSCELDEEQMLRFADLRKHQKLFYIVRLFLEKKEIDAGTKLVILLLPSRKALAVRIEQLTVIEQGREIQKIMQAHQKAENFSLLELPDCGHIIDPPYMPLNDFLYQGGRYMAFGGEPYAHGLGQHIAWNEVLKFLRTNIGPGAEMRESECKL